MGKYIEKELYLIKYNSNMLHPTYSCNICAFLTKEEAEEELQFCINNNDNNEFKFWIEELKFLIKPK